MKTVIVALMLLGSFSSAHALEVYVGAGGCYTDPLVPLCEKVLVHAGASQELYKKGNLSVEVKWDHFSQPHDGFGGLGFDYGSVNVKYKLF